MLRLRSECRLNKFSAVAEHDLSFFFDIRANSTPCVLFFFWRYSVILSFLTRERDIANASDRSACTCFRRFLNFYGLLKDHVHADIQERSSR